jgi:hypothetical protein
MKSSSHMMASPKASPSSMHSMKSNNHMMMGSPKPRPSLSPRA